VHDHFSWSSIFLVNLPVVIARIGRLTVPTSPLEAPATRTGSARLHAAN
jgi:hypothetical protein